MKTDAIYVGRRITAHESDKGNPIVEVDAPIYPNSACRRHRRLSPKPSQQLINHSPDGFEWGCCESGPSQLALGILLDFTGDAELSLARYQEFKRNIVAPLPDNAWRITGSFIAKWLAAQGAGEREATSI